MLSTDKSIGSIRAVNDEGNLPEELKEFHPDVVITEIHSPDSDPMEVTKLVKETLPETAVIVLTTSENNSHVVDAIEAGLRVTFSSEKPRWNRCKMLSVVPMKTLRQ